MNFHCNRCLKLGVFAIATIYFFPQFKNAKIETSPSNPNKTWFDQLPNCPCENPDKNGVKINDGWAADKGNFEKYHRGAVASFRSYPFVKTEAGKSGQQCCYDANHQLITDGSGAGTPDKVSTCKGEDKNGTMKIRFWGLWGHYRKDVLPWKKVGGEQQGWKKYNLLWKPNKGNGCPNNTKSGN